MTTKSAAPTEFALLREYYTPVAVAEAVADLVPGVCPDPKGHDGAFDSSLGIGRLVRALGRRNHDH